MNTWTLQPIKGTLKQEEGTPFHTPKLHYTKIKNKTIIVIIKIKVIKKLLILRPPISTKFFY